MPHDLDLLQGSWTVTGLELDGQPMPSHMLAEAAIVVEGNRFTSSGMGAVYEGTVSLNPSTVPRRIDMKFDGGPEKGNSNLGIYELAGDTWRICLATRGTVRPAAFASTPGSGFALETLTRGKPAGAKPKRAGKAAERASEAGASATEFDGEWRLVSAVMDGKAMDKSAVEWVKRVSAGNQTTVYAGPQIMLKVEFTSDTSTSPKTIDYRNLAGPNKGKSQLGIYELEGGLLTFCIAAPGAERPRNFQSGAGLTLTVWKRA